MMFWNHKAMNLNEPLESKPLFKNTVLEKKKKNNKTKQKTVFLNNFYFGFGFMILLCFGLSWQLC